MIDLRYEYLALRNAVLRGRQDRRASLQDVLRYYGLPRIAEKQEMRELAMRSCPSDTYTTEERAALLDYCAEDVRALEQLLPLMLLGLRLDEAVWRGRFSCAMAVTERNGVPLDEELARWISDNRDRIRRRAIAELDHWGFYRCQKAMFEAQRRERGQAIRRPHECNEACEQWFDTGAFVDWLEEARDRAGALPEDWQPDAEPEGARRIQGHVRGRGASHQPAQRLERPPREQAGRGA